MPMDVPTLRKLVALDESDPLSRFALGNGLYTLDGSPGALEEAAEHLTVANARAPNHLATYHVLGQVLIRLDRKEDARRVLEAGVKKASGVREGMGKDLGPAMQALLATL
jgi:hypothetical protein